MTGVLGSVPLFDTGWDLKLTTRPQPDFKPCSRFQLTTRLGDVVLRIRDYFAFYHYLIFNVHGLISVVGHRTTYETSAHCVHNLKSQAFVS